MVQKEPKDEKAPRGRPRAYDPDAALANATGAFWRAGFSATSLDELSAATGMNRPSLYGAFGDKRALYLQALKRYTEEGRAAMHEALAPGPDLRESLLRVYDAALALYLPKGEAPRGCFLINTGSAESLNDDDVRAQLAGALREFDREFEQRFRRAQAEGELDAEADPVLLSKVASALLHTLALRSRAGDGRAAMRATAVAGVELICGPAGGRKSRPTRGG
ncbi:MAG TPA: TetR/AcrR family transcriptional regulator [Burkholderiales bacterium]|jgi:AcrR family transcriptional regulator